MCRGTNDNRVLSASQFQLHNLRTGGPILKILALFDRELNLLLNRIKNKILDG